MNITKALAGLSAGLLLAGAAQGPALAQSPSAAASPASLEGRPVRGQGGVLLGHVERVILRSDGSPAQVLVRPKGPPAAGPRSLSYGALKLAGDGLVAPLTEAEFAAMPAVSVK